MARMWWARAKPRLRSRQGLIVWGLASHSEGFGLEVQQEVVKGLYIGDGFPEVILAAEWRMGGRAPSVGTETPGGEPLVRETLKAWARGRGMEGSGRMQDIC